MPETTELEKEYRETREEHNWYREELLEMAEDDEQGTELWEEYREKMKKTGKELMKLSRKRSAQANEPAETTDPLVLVREALRLADDKEEKGILELAHNEIVDLRASDLTEEMDGE